MLKQTVVWIFTPAIMAFILIMISITARNLPFYDATILTGLGIAGLIALTSAPLIVGGIMIWVSAFGFYIGVLGAALYGEVAKAVGELREEQ